VTTPFSTPDAAGKSWAPDIRFIPPQDLIADSLLLTITTKGGTIEGDAPQVLCPYVDLLDAPDFVAEGAAIEESEPNDSEIAVSTGKVGLLVPVSREQWGQPDVANLLSAATRDALVRKVNHQLLAQPAPTPPATTPPAGLLAQSYTEGGNIDADLDALVDAVAVIEASGGQATNVVIHPYAWAAVQKLKTAADANTTLLGAGVEAAERRLLNIPVTVDMDAPTSGLLVLDRRSVISAYGAVQLAVSSDYYFNRDSVGVRATLRFGAVIANAQRVVHVSVGGDLS
jgi:HK97 family phage major capsid protein